MEGELWGLVIVASAFFIQVLAFGTSASVGVYLIEFLDYFDSDNVGVSLVAAINFAVFLGSGPFASFLMTQMSYRKVTFIGSALSVIGVFITPFLPYIPAMCIFFGFLTGLGSCLVYLPSHVLSGLYYERHRSLATGVATSGSGLGGAVMPIVVGYLIQHFGWKGSLIVLAGFELHLFVCSAVLRDPPKRSSKPVANQSESEGLLKHVDEKDSKAEAKKETLGTEVLLELQSEVDTKDVSNCGTEGFAISEGVTETNDLSCDGHKNNEVSTLVAAKCEKSIMSKAQDTVSLKEGEKVLRHIYLFTNLGFNVYFVSNLFWNVTGAMIMSFAAEFVTERGLDPLDGAWIASIFGFGGFLGGLLGGLLGNMWQRHRMGLYVVSNLLLGLCAALLPLGSGYGQFAGIIFSAGLAFGVILGLLIVVLTDLIGSLSLADGMGYLMLANGVGCFIGPALAGYMRQVMGCYDLAFYTGGAFAVAAGVIMIAIPLLRPFCHS